MTLASGSAKASGWSNEAVSGADSLAELIYADLTSDIYVLIGASRFGTA